MPYFAELFAAPHQLTRRRANPHRALRNQGESNKLALLLIVCTGIPAYAQGKEWETLLGRIMALSGQGRYDDATVTGSREGASMAATSPPTEASCCLKKLEQQTGIVRRFAACFTDYRKADQIEHPLLDLIAQRVFGLALGKDDVKGQQRRRAQDRGKALAVPPATRPPETLVH